MKKTFNILLVLSLWTVSFSTSFAQTIRYVKPTASGTGDGTSWANASASPQLMINAATAGDEIWVAAGTYLPTHDPLGSTTPTDPRDKTFYLKNGVKLYGGFVGTETALSERSWLINATILSGDFNGNDAVSGTSISNNTENAYHVILSVSDNSATVLDGFTVRGGYASSSLSLTVETKSISRIAGAGMHNNASSPTIQNCIFYANVVYSGNGNGGGGIYNTASAPNINNCLFKTNILVFSGSGVPATGAAILNVTGSSATITNCIFTSNLGATGSCIRNTSANPSVFNCTFSANLGKPVISNSSTNTSLTIKNCLIWSNGSGPSDIGNASGADATVTNCITNIAYTGTGSNNSTSDPKFINSSDPDGADNIWFTADDGYRLGCGSSAFNTGTNTGAPALDVLGNSIFATTKDIGAYEAQTDLTLPTVYTVTGGGSYCSGGTGVAVGLTNSETTATYQLKNGASNVGAAATGVGTSFNYSNQTAAGTYTVVATNAANGCTANMTGNAVITITPTVTPSVSIVSDDADNSINAGTSVTFTASQTNGGTTPQYQWQKNGANVGANDPSYTNATLVNNDVIRVILTSNETCPSTPTATSNEITMSVSGVLPVELLDFKGTPQYNGNLLTWTTANEVNNKGFYVERIMDNGQWTILGFKTANNKASSYDFTDNTPLSTSYYRLRQIDNDGKETYSKVVSVSNQKSSKLITYPNPVSNVLTVETDNKDVFQIFNFLGQQVLSGKTTRHIDVSALPQGTYFLKVGTEQVKFIK